MKIMINKETGGYRMTIDIAFASYDDMQSVFKAIEQGKCSVLGISKVKPYTRDAIFCAIRIKDVIHSVKFVGASFDAADKASSKNDPNQGGTDGIDPQNSSLTADGSDADLEEEDSQDDE